MATRVVTTLTLILAMGALAACEDEGAEVEVEEPAVVVEEQTASD